jgi:hypothetical protein
MNDLQRRVARAAERFGHNWIGAEHVVLALLDPGDSSRAGRALRECGISQEGYAEAIAQLREDYTVRPGLGEGVREVSRELIALGAEIPKAQLPPDLAWQEPRVVSRSEFKELQAEFKRQGIQYGCKAQGEQILVFTAQLTPA